MVMSLIRPFAALRPPQQYAAQVLAPPYDVLNTAEARTLVAHKPWSFLHISKPEIDLPAATDPYSAEVYAKAKENFAKMLSAGMLERDTAPHYYIYRLTMGAHTQTGVAAVASIDAYRSNRIRKHEHTRPDKEDDRVRQIDAVNAQTGPVFLTHRRSTTAADLTDLLTQGAPAIDVVTDDGVRHCLWVVSDQERLDELTAAFDALDRLYICDGHHRCAAAARVAAARAQANRGHTGSEPYNYFLAVIFPDNETRILDYNRVIKDTHGLTLEVLLARLRAVFVVAAEASSVQPRKSHEFGMYVNKNWYRLNIKPELVPRIDPLRRLDVNILQEQVIAPLFGIADPRRDQRIDFVGGIRGLRELERRVDSGERSIAFALYPTALVDLMAVADAGEVMPPKSTWFEPKLADGLVSHLL